MKSTTAILLFSVLGLGLLAGCSTVPTEPATTVAAVPAPTPAAAAPVSAVARGNVVPVRLHTMAPRRSLIDETIQVSNAASPLDSLAPINPAPTLEDTGFLKIIDAGSRASTFSLAIDSTEGDARIYLGPHTYDVADTQAALRDIQILDPDGVQINLREPHPGQALADVAPMSDVDLRGHRAGTYTVKLGAVVSKAGMTIDVRMPSAAFPIRIKSSTAQHLLGDVATVDVEFPASATVTAIEGNLLLPETGTRGASLPFVALGAGRYRVDIGSLMNEKSAIGAYRFEIRASGTNAAGQPWQRSGISGFRFGIPTAQISKVSSTRAVTGADGKITAFEVDVDVQSTTLDRLQVGAILVATGADGVEHPIASAQTGSGFPPGTKTVTLRFDAGAVQMTRLEGDLSLRRITLYSAETDTMFHRDEGGMAVVFRGIQRASLARATSLTPAMEELVLNGALHQD